jgi:hypothetical protein
MRLQLLALGVALLAPASLPAQSIVVRFTFDSTRATAAEPGAVLSERQRMRAWQDTVEVYLAQLAPASGLRLAGAELPPNYTASVVAAPVGRPGVRGMTLAVVVFEPGTSTAWQYLAHFTAYAESAREAAGSLIGQTVAAVSAPRP